jgi:hypothetical protein
MIAKPVVVLVTSLLRSVEMKVFQYDKKVWEDYDDTTSHTWQFGILKNRSFLWVNYENPTAQHWSSGGFHIVLSFLSNSLFGVELNNDKQCLAFEFFGEYFSGWEE